MRVLLCICALLVAVASCRKSIYKAPPEDLPFNATVYWSGPPSLDGLGWVLRFESGKMEKPSNLAEQFQVNGLKVWVEYETTNDKYPCFCTGGFVYMIKIVSITKS